MMHWFYRDWWAYLLAKRNWMQSDQWFLPIIWCRMRGHPAGFVWFNTGGTEPDYHCKNCGDDLG